MNALPKKVLVVDDDPVVGKSFERILSEKGYAVSTAASGAEALKKFAGEAYDVVFADIKMPGMDGLEVAERIKERRPWVPVVIITGYGTPAHEARADAMGVADFLHKPLSPETIERSARKALRVIEGGAARAAPEAAAALLTTPVPALPPAMPEAAAAPAADAPEDTERGAALYLKNVGLFLVAPFIGLAYVVAFPLVAIGLLLRAGVRALMGRSKS